MNSSSVKPQTVMVDNACITNQNNTSVTPLANLKLTNTEMTILVYNYFI
jgi:hypothetical protein